MPRSWSSFTSLLETRYLRLTKLCIKSTRKSHYKSGFCALPTQPLNQTIGRIQYYFYCPSICLIMVSTDQSICGCHQGCPPCDLDTVWHGVLLTHLVLQILKPRLVNVNLFKVSGDAKFSIGTSWTSVLC